MISVHDYHLMPLARELRARGHENPIGFFLHIPCPPPDILFTLPKHDESLGALIHYDLVGFQTDKTPTILGAIWRKGGLSAARPIYNVEGRRVRIGAFPVSIATAIFARVPAAGDRLCRGISGKSWPQTSHSGRRSSRLLEGDPATYPGLVTFSTRSRVAGRSDVPPGDAEESRRGARIRRHGAGRACRADQRPLRRPAWTPIRYVNRSYSRASLAGLYRAAEVGLVTPLRDGINLVAKEYVAAQDPENPGVLILSQFAGAAAELDGALLVNPHEMEAFPAAISTALDMPLEERVARHATMFHQIEKHDVDHWAGCFLTALTETRRKSGLLGGIRSLFKERTKEA